MHATAAELAERIWDAELVGDPQAVALAAKPFDRAAGGVLTWLRPGRPAHLTGVEAAILVCGRHFPWRPDPSSGQAAIRCDNPRLGFGKALAHLYRHHLERPPSIPPSARIHESAVIGAPGLSLEWDERERRWFELPHIASVYIADHVRIDPLVTVMRGLLSDTILSVGVIVGNHANVGHGAEIERHAVLGPHASIGGSARIGERAFIGQGAMIRNGVCVGERAVIGQAANVVCDVPAGETWAGNPARRNS